MGRGCFRAWRLSLWAGNTARCGLLADGGGPFSEYLADRKAKGFTAVLMQCNIVTRLADDCALTPARPVFCAEAFYEVATDPESAYHARWQGRRSLSGYHQDLIRRMKIGCC